MNDKRGWQDKGTNELSHSTEILKKLIVETGAEVVDRPERNKKKANKVREFSAKILFQLDQIQSQLDTLIDLIRENLKSEQNDHGILHGSLDEYATHLKLQRKKLQAKFRQDSNKWLQAAKDALNERFEHDRKVRKYLHEQQKLYIQIFTPERPKKVKAASAAQSCSRDREYINIPTQSYSEIKDFASTSKKMQQHMYETRWRCWRCKSVHKMDRQCPNCNKYLQDYPFDDVKALLVHIKLTESLTSELVQDDKSFTGHKVSHFNSQVEESQCRKCNETVFAGQQDYCYRCRPKCSLCQVLFALPNSGQCEYCLSKARKLRHQEQIQEALVSRNTAVFVSHAGQGTCIRCQRYGAFAKVGSKIMCCGCQQVVWPEDMIDYEEIKTQESPQKLQQPSQIKSPQDQKER